MAEEKLSAIGMGADGLQNCTKPDNNDHLALTFRKPESWQPADSHITFPVVAVFSCLFVAAFLVLVGRSIGQIVAW